MLLYPGDAAAALLLTEDDRYVLQQRDEKAGIFFPGFWGAFGGAIEKGETPEQALFRELREEVDIEFQKCETFCQLGMDFSYAGAGTVMRHYFIVPISAAEIGRMSVREGQGYRIFSGDAVMEMAKVTPYDALAIFQHFTRHQIGGRYRGGA